jgi:hypothetical protein
MKQPRISKEGTILFLLVDAAILLNISFLYLYNFPFIKDFDGDEAMYFDRAAAIAAGNPVTFSILWPTFYPKVMGALFSVTGPTVVAIQALQIIMLFLSGLLWRRITLKLTGSQLAANVTVALFLLSPHLIAFSHYLFAEIFHIFFFSGALWLLIVHSDRPWIAPIAGFLVGLCLLTKLLLLPFVPLIVIYAAFLTSGGYKRKLAQSALFLAVLVITIIPTMVSNYKSKGIFAIADSSSFNLWAGWGDTEYVGYRNDVFPKFIQFSDSADNDKDRLDFSRKAVAGELRKRGICGILKNQIPRQFFVIFNCDSFFTTQLPGEPRGSYHFSNEILIALLKVFSYGSYALLLVLSLFGICLTRVHKVGWLQFLIVFILCNIGLCVLMHANTRFRIQFTPALMVYAGIAAAYFFDRDPLSERLGDALCKKFSAPRVVTFIFLAVAFLLFAFRSKI